ncbi:unnamed protein product [Orchesella dallaii]|uniref:Vacuolar-sorting protein SNF8 n=1 Tax=Orchesella dallaii TaxID=48710 RepID=A0ABP1PY73_9HEXA
MRRRVGVASVVHSRNAEQLFTKKSTIIDQNSIAKLETNLEELKQKLKWFASKHQVDLQTDAAFRNEFLNMCKSIGVDPLASSKGYWTQYLGVGTYYYTLAVQIVETILSGVDRHGGIMLLKDLWIRLERHRPNFLQDSHISFEDIFQSLKLMKSLGKGCGYIRTSSQKSQIDQGLVYCVPEELKQDQTLLLTNVGQSGKCCFKLTDVADSLGWGGLRTKTAVDQLIRDGIVWVEKRGGSEGEYVRYWLPGLFLNNSYEDDE